MAKTDYYRSSATRQFLRAVPGEPDGIPILDDATDPGVLFPKDAGFGHDPSQYVPDMMAAPHQMQLIDPSEYDARYDEQEAAQSSLEHLYLREWQGPCLDQNGHGYCWSYSTGSATMLRRLAMNLPFKRLNPHSVAAIIKNGADQGGWCGLSLAKYREIGCAEEGTGPGQWPVHSRQVGRFSDPAVKAAMLLNRVTDDWYDLGQPLHGQKLTRQQLVTCLFNNSPSPTDFNWWGHSVCSIRYVRISAGEWGLLILNSWKGWGRQGLAVLRGSKAVPDGAVSAVNVRAA